MNKVCYLGLGSNLHSPERQLRRVISKLRKTPQIIILSQSSIYHTLPWGYHAQPNFCNQVIKIQTTLTPFGLLKKCQDIEKNMGRVRKKRWGPRIIDIDILMFGDLKLKTPFLTIPHPYISQRDFVFKPLAELSLTSPSLLPVSEV